MKQNKLENTKNKTNKIWQILSGLAFLLPAMFAFSMQRILSLYPNFTENIYSSVLYKWISLPIVYIVGVFPFSLTEISLYLSLPAFIILVIFIIKGIKKSNSKKTTILKYLKKIGWTFSILYLIFMLLLGFNYSRLPLSESMNIEVKQRDSKELEKVCYILLNKVNYLRDNVNEENGVMTLPNGVNEALKTGYEGYKAISEVYPQFKGPSVRAKGVIASHLWSYTGITGMYFPFFVEANVNIDVPHYSIPSTIMHELAHLRGIAREDDAEFAAFISGINHPKTYFKYSSYLNAFMYCRNALYSADKEAFIELSSQLSEKVQNDLSSGAKYWKGFEGPVEEISTKVNDSYLKSNMQQEGVASYGKVVDLFLGYYLSDN